MPVIAIAVPRHLFVRSTSIGHCPLRLCGRLVRLQNRDQLQFSLLQGRFQHHGELRQRATLQTNLLGDLAVQFVPFRGIAGMEQAVKLSAVACVPVGFTEGICQAAKGG